MTWRDYHEATKHTPDSLRRSRRALDWANMPDPFRHYEGVPLLDLPADPPSPGILALDVLQGSCGSTRATSGAEFLSQLLYYSAAISASKRVPHSGDKYALRVNPSSGNLHPTEFHFFTRGLKDWPDGLYHYRPSSHMAEQRACGDFGLNTPIVFILTTIAWREAWKYRDRAYRYCLLDMGHAGESLRLAAHAMGCEARASSRFTEDCRAAEDEWPMLRIEFRGDTIPQEAQNKTSIKWFGGVPNQLSKEVVPYPLIDEVHAATSDGTEIPVQRSITRPLQHSSTRAFGEVVRSRRSALDFEGGPWSIARSDLNTLLAATRPHYIELYVYAHRVEGLTPGVYRYQPHSEDLEVIVEGDQRVAAAGLSLGQDLAGNSCVTFSMIGALDRAAELHGDAAYRYVHFEAGAIGQRLYIAAEALGLRATGIGAFFDDSVHGYLGIAPAQGQVVYHFAIGYPVDDPRLEAFE